MTVAAIDMGTNSTRLLITDEAGAELERHMHITRLGQAVDVTGALHPDAIARTVQVLEQYAERLRAHGVRAVRITATSAARDAKNRDAFFDQVKATTGYRPELLTGDQEAALSFAGATAGLDAGDGPFLVVDIGGGSTEFVLGSDAPEQLISVDMGCVRMTERFLHSDPPTEAELDACRKETRRLLERVREKVDVGRTRRMLGLAGTVTSLGAMQAGLREYDPDKTHGMTLRQDEVRALFSKLASAPLDVRRTLLLEPKRAEVIVAGALVLLQILEDFDLDALTVSESDILDGLAASLRT